MTRARKIVQKIIDFNHASNRGKRPWERDYDWSLMKQIHKRRLINFNRTDHVRVAKRYGSWYVWQRYIPGDIGNLMTFNPEYTTKEKALRTYIKTMKLENIKKRLWK